MLTYIDNHGKKKLNKRFARILEARKKKGKKNARKS